MSKPYPLHTVVTGVGACASSATARWVSLGFLGHRIVDTRQARMQIAQDVFGDGVVNGQGVGADVLMAVSP